MLILNRKVQLIIILKVDFQIRTPPRTSEKHADDHESNERCAWGDLRWARGRKCELLEPLSNYINNTLSKFRGKRRSRRASLIHTPLFLENLASFGAVRSRREQVAGRVRQKI